MRLIRRLAYWSRFRREQAALREELESHRELLVEHLQSKGYALKDARAAARRVLGNETYMREEARGVWLGFTLESIWMDCAYAWRGLRRSPMFAALVVGMTGLTLAANTIVFSVIDSAWLAPLPFPAGHRIVRLGSEPVADPLAVQFGLPAEVFRELIARSRALDEFAAVQTHGYRDPRTPSAPSVAVGSITPSFLSMLRVRPVLGRTFGISDTMPGAPPTAMIGFREWQTQYAAARGVIGRVVKIDGASRTIIGVLPDGFAIPMSMSDTPELWVPLNLASASNVEGFARLRPGASSADASRELQAIARTIPDSGELKGLQVVARTARDQIAPRDWRTIQLLFATVCTLLLIACANIANLLLMRGWTRHRELAIRAALGAARARLARQLLIESVLLSLLGGAAGLPIAWLTLHALIAIYPGGPMLGALATLGAIRMNVTVVAWTAGLSVATGLLFGAGPAFLSGAGGLVDALRAGSLVATSGTTARRLRNALVVGEIALSLVFLTTSALLARSFVALARTPVGLDPKGLVTIDVHLSRPLPPTQRNGIEQTLIKALRASPGVRGAAFGGGLAQTDIQGGPFAIESRNGAQVLDLAFCEMPFVGREYFDVSRIPLVQGRTFSNDPAVAGTELVVNQTFARRFWPGRDAIGLRLRIDEGQRARWLTVVGVAGDVHLPGTSGDLFNLQMYRPASVAPRLMSDIVLRVDERAGALEPMLRRAVESAGISATLGDVWRTESVIDRRVLARPRFALAVFSVFALIAVAVCAVGLYGLVAYSVMQRRREIGIRVALGAASAALARLILTESGGLLFFGATLGAVGSLLASRLVSRFLYQVRPGDPVALGVALFGIMFVALAATMLPLYRALHVDPIDALRAD